MEQNKFTLGYILQFFFFKHKFNVESHICCIWNYNIDYWDSFFFFKKLDCEIVHLNIVELL